MPTATNVFYSSSNGDRWYFVHALESGQSVVCHEPNLSSGGQVSEFSIPTFLSHGGNSPQAEALRKMLAEQGVINLGNG